MDAIIKNFLTAKTADGLAPATMRDYRMVLGRFRETITTPEQLSRATIRRYVADMRGNGWAEGTCGLHVRYIRAFLRWLWREGHTTENYAQAIKTPRQSIRWEELMTPEEFQDLVAACTGKYAARDRAIILFLVDTGMRRGEFIGLTRDQVRFTDGGAWLHLDAPKTHDKRYAMIGTATARALRAYLDTRMDDDPAMWMGRCGPMGYHAIYHMLRRRADDAGIDPKKCHPHAFRKLFASWWIQNGGDEQRLMALGGWSGPEMLRIYVCLGSREHLQDAHARYGPVDRLFEK